MYHGRQVSSLQCINKAITSAGVSTNGRIQLDIKWGMHLSLHFTSCTLHFALGFALYTLHWLCFTLNTLRFMLFTLHFLLILYNLHFTLNTFQSFRRGSTLTPFELISSKRPPLKLHFDCCTSSSANLNATSTAPHPQWQSSPPETCKNCTPLKYMTHQHKYTNTNTRHTISNIKYKHQIPNNVLEIFLPQKVKGGSRCCYFITWQW